MANATTEKGAMTPWRLPCPKCGALADPDTGEGGLAVRVSGLQVFCIDCGDDISRAEIRQMIDEGRKLLAWLDLASTL
jgi:hypothetical protein